MFETKSFLDKAFYKKLFTMIDRKWSSRLYFFSLITLLDLGVLVPFFFLPYGIYVWLAFTVVYFLYAVYRYRGRAEKLANNIILSNKECSNSDSLSYITSFDNEGIRYKNLTTKAEGVVKYEHFSTIYDVDGYYYLVSKSGKGLPVNKTLLTEQERKACVEHLKNKISKAKWEF